VLYTSERLGGQEPTHQSEHHRVEIATGAGSRRAKKPYGEPQLRVLTGESEIPDSFPSASAFREAGYRTYHSIYTMSREELAALEGTIGSNLVKQILALRRQ